MKIRLKNILNFCIAVFICSNAFSQSYDNNWVFGDSASLNFEIASPISGLSSIMTWEACASISDDAGNLLFYTNGEKVWNKLHNVMLNGDSLQIGEVFPPYGSSITQGVIIIPIPGSFNLYYIFQLQHDASEGKYGLEYSIVNMELNDGFGDLIEKNFSFFDVALEEKMQVVKHGNGRDWWLLVRRFDQISEEERNIDFVKFLITPEGIEGPYYQHIGPEYDEYLDFGWGQMKFSSDGSKMLFPRQTDLNLFDFDRCSGELSNLIEIKNIGLESYGCSFSPDGTKIYVSGSCEKNLYQYCLSCDGEPIDSTKELVYDGPTGSYCLMQHQIGPDGKIYIVTCYNVLPNDIFTIKNQNLCVINSPNSLFPLCDFDTNTVSLGTRRVINCLPNMPNYNLGPLAGSECDTLGTAINNIVEENKITVYPNPVFDNLTLHSDNNSELHYKIKSIQGQIIASGNFIKQANINFKNYLPGIYLLEIFDLNSKLIQVEKIVKE